MPHLRTSSALLAPFRSSYNTTLRAPLNKRFFTPSATNMVIKTYFDCTWTGPEVQVDSNGKVTSTGDVKGKQSIPSPSAAAVCIAMSAISSSLIPHLSVLD